MVKSFRLYVDSAETSEVGPFLNDGLVAGVTTNPTILMRASRSPLDMAELYRLWDEQGAREIFFQTWGGNKEAFLRNARGIVELGANVVVKIPATLGGFAAATTLVADNVPVLLTAVYSSAQAIAAASIGVAYIAPYLGRLDDAGHNGLEVIAEMHSLVAGTGTHVLAASVRSSNDIVNLAAKGISMFTAAPAVLREVFQDSVSDRSAEDFEEAVSRSR